MKKFLNLISVFVFGILLIAGCSCKKDDESKVSLSIGDMTATTFKDIELSYLDAMIEDDESFVLYVYTSCTACDAFKPVINGVIKDRNLRIYAIAKSKITSKHELASIRTAPAVVIYNEGEVFAKAEYDNNQEYFNDKAGFTSFLDKYTYMPTMYYVSLDQLDQKIANDESFVIYYSRSSCGDCNYLNSNYLKKYLKENVNTKHFYVIETDAEGIRFTNGQFDENNWIEFKNKYGLSNVNNSLGHGVGYVPSFQYYENGEIKDMMVYFNDGEYVLNNDDTYSIVINASYYDDNPYINQTIKLSEYHEKVSPFYNEKLKTFLETNLAKVD